MVPQWNMFVHQDQVCVACRGLLVDSSQGTSPCLIALRIDRLVHPFQTQSGLDLVKAIQPLSVWSGLRELD